jgi:hypothetical protein
MQSYTKIIVSDIPLVLVTTRSAKTSIPASAAKLSTLQLSLFTVLVIAAIFALLYFTLRELPYGVVL